MKESLGALMTQHVRLANTESDNAAEAYISIGYEKGLSSDSENIGFGFGSLFIYDPSWLRQAKCIDCPYLIILGQEIADQVCR